jgi:ubiquinone/menaquinone biosynthesis C-methylase UbiE
MDEVQRIRDVYGKRREKLGGIYSRFFSRQREREIKEAVTREGFTSLLEMKILDIGCGNGAILTYFLKEGVPQENLYGIDLSPERIEEAKRLYPGICFSCGNAEKLPYSNEFFDIITQSTVFTSILDIGMKKEIAFEMIRVLKEDGVIIWHDYRFNNPLNRDARGIGKRQIMNLFPGCAFNFKLTNLNPFIARPLSRFSLKLCEILEMASFLLTHWLVIIRKNDSSSKENGG